MSLSILSILKAFSSVQTEGTLHAILIDQVSIDSRSLLNNKQTLFFALKGMHHDAHQFIPDIINQGVKIIVVEKLPENFDPTICWILVPNSLKALQEFASFYRKKYTFPIVGITGSNGKTIVKEWLNFLLSPDFNIIRSPKSYNSQVGVPLSVLGINDFHEFGIFEAGISTVNEMENLANIIQATIGILTTIGSAHDEGFENIAEKIKEKLKLFESVSVLIYRKNKTIESFISPFKPTFSWSSTEQNADIFVRFNPEEDQCLATLHYKNEQVTLVLPFTDEASIENAMQCVALLVYLQYDWETIKTRIQLLYPIQMRLQLKKGIQNTSVIDDSYSSDFQSLKIALDFLENQKQHNKKTVIISDIYQSGLSADALYSRLTQLLIASKINRVICIGKEISQYQKKFVNAQAFESTDAFIKQFNSIHFANETILIKGARSFEFEKIVSLLEERTHETVLEINLNAITHNLNYFKAKLQKSTLMMVMVKAFGYGSGGVEIAKLLAYQKVDYLGVAFTDEGITLRKNKIDTRILVLNPESTSFSAIIQYCLEPEIYCMKGLLLFIKIAKEKNVKNYPIHIKLDTGMHRLGFNPDDLPILIETLKNQDLVEVRSILSHLATSDSVDKTFAQKQIDLFKTLTEKLESALGHSTIKHILNTSGISNFQEAQFDMVRLGIGLYGISNDASEQPFLSQVGTLKSVISQIRTIEAGESVGYGQKYIAKKTTKIATIPIGYADGIRRSWGNEVGYVVINNQRAPILGSVCMDMLMVDITEIVCQESGPVTIFGADPSVQLMAKKLDTIPYEIIATISQRVKRIFYRE
uniref:bifunctional UDP-N-acetylmuramoyl-tripeptide:D-alanyl-D-alanine ligase/alanine racemase n=1 Tax=Flavobacterium sp. TaxID=239 RepID=UPI00404A0FDC